jgi:hypothetical protein
MRRVTSVPLHPLFAALLPVASMYAVYPARSDLDELLVAFAVVLAVGALIWGICSVFLRDMVKGAVLATAGLLLVVFMSQGMFVALEASRLGHMGLARRRYVLIIVGTALALLARRLHRTRQSLTSVTLVLNVTTAGFLLPPLASLTLSHLTTAGTAVRHGPPVAMPVRGAAAQSAPDIYYIVLDRYGSAETMRQHGLDNRPFYRFLESRGFYIARESHSNYMKTALSLSSSLNLTYHDDVVRTVGGDSANWRPINYRLRHHVAGRFLREQGYRYIHAGSWWWPTRSSDYADENINYFAAVPQPLMLLFEQPLVAAFAQGLDSPFVDERLQQWERVHRQFAALLRVPAQPGPKFVFAHILVPHPPYVFNADGSYVSRSLQGRRSRNENYVNQVLLANRLVSGLVDRILADSASPPVILVQGDEGPYGEHMGGTDAYRFRTMTAADIQFRSGILNAYHLPGRGSDLLYPSISPVNSLRVVFNAYLGTSLPLLPDRVYRHDSEKRPYSFVDVTAVARGAESAGRHEPVSISRVVQKVAR